MKTVFLILVVLSSYSIAQDLSSECLEKLKSFGLEAWTPNFRPTTVATEAWFQYKNNNSNTNPKQYDLDSLESSYYDDMLIRSKRGDILKAKGIENVVMGRFFGRGNNTHIYKAENLSSTAIRVPFSPIGSSGDRIQYGRRELLLYKSTRPTVPHDYKGDLRVVDIKATSEAGSLMLVEEVDFETDGLSLLMKYSRLSEKELNDQQRYFTRNVKDIDSFLSKSEDLLKNHFSETNQRDGLKIQKLIRSYRAFTQMQRFNHLSILRQLLWSSDEQKWIAVDW